MVVNAKVLFIGLDSLEPDLALEMCEAGEMPVLQSLIENGLSGVNLTPRGFGNGVMWPCLYTGVNPGKHGRYFYHQLKTGSYQTYFFNDDTDLGHEPVWSALSEAGKRVAVIDMVRGPLVKNLNGLQIADWLAHDRRGEPRSWPPDLINSVIDSYGDDPFGGVTDLAGRKGLKEYKKLCSQMFERVDTKTEMSCRYLEQGPWDLFATVYGDPHDLGHQCWHFHDASHPSHDPQLVAEIGDPIRQLYVHIDQSIGRLVEAAGQGATVIVFGGPGMESSYTASFLLDQILRRLEGPEGDDGLTYVDTLKKLYRIVVPPRIRNLLAGAGQKGEQAMLASDRRKRKCFALPNNENAGAIRFNMIGREPEGTIRPSDRAAFADELIADLKDIINLDTGEPIVEDVVRVFDDCSGDRVEDLPDLLVIWHRPVPIQKVGSPKIGEIEAENPGGRTGDHTPHALFVASGPEIESGVRAQDSSVMDVGYTLASLLALSQRTWMVRRSRNLSPAGDNAAQKFTVILIWAINFNFEERPLKPVRETGMLSRRV